MKNFKIYNKRCVLKCGLEVEPGFSSWMNNDGNLTICTYDEWIEISKTNVNENGTEIELIYHSMQVMDSKEYKLYNKHMDEWRNSLHKIEPSACLYFDTPDILYRYEAHLRYHGVYFVTEYDKSNGLKSPSKNYSMAALTKKGYEKFKMFEVDSESACAFINVYPFISLDKSIYNKNFSAYLKTNDLTCLVDEI